MEYFISYILPALVLFIAQTALCLWCKNKYIRLIPTVIAFGIALYHSGVVLGNLDNLWVAGLGLAYLAMTALPVLAAVGFGWVIYVVKLMIREAKNLKHEKRPPKAVFFHSIPWTASISTTVWPRCVRAKLPWTGRPL